MSAWPPRFLFISGRLCLDFAQTGAEGCPPQWERLRTPRDLADWLAACLLKLRLTSVSARELSDARALREVIWAAVHAVRRRRPFPAQVTIALNAAAQRPDLAPALDGGGVGWAASARVSHALSSIARDAVRLFGGSARRRLRKCRNPHCQLLFVDESRPGRRAWCTMRRCGNMEKTRRYRRSRARSRQARKA